MKKTLTMTTKKGITLEVGEESLPDTMVKRLDGFRGEK